MLTYYFPLAVLVVWLKLVWKPLDKPPPLTIEGVNMALEAHTSFHPPPVPTTE